jgi:hypothetical protein
MEFVGIDIMELGGRNGRERHVVTDQNRQSIK